MHTPALFVRPFEPGGYGLLRRHQMNHSPPSLSRPAPVRLVSACASVALTVISSAYINIGPGCISVSRSLPTFATVPVPAVLRLPLRPPVQAICGSGTEQEENAQRQRAAAMDSTQRCLAAVLVLSALLHASRACLAADRDCSLDMHCCSGYCNKPSAASVYGKCGGGGGGGGQESYEVQFWPHANHAGSGLVYTGTGEHDLGVCRGFGAGFEHLNDAVSSIKWSDNVVLVVYDAYNCGGNNHVIYSSGPHETMNTEFGKTRAQGFLAGYENDLATVCMRTRCGYTSSSQMRSHNVGGSAGFSFFVDASASYNHEWGTDEGQAWDGCECERSWNDAIRSYQILRRDIGSSRNVRSVNNTR